MSFTDAAVLILLLAILSTIFSVLSTKLSNFRFVSLIVFENKKGENFVVLCQN